MTKQLVPQAVKIAKTNKIELSERVIVKEDVNEKETRNGTLLNS
jgi:hypothetical protein